MSFEQIPPEILKYGLGPNPSKHIKPVGIDMPIFNIPPAYVFGSEGASKPSDAPEEADTPEEISINVDQLSAAFTGLRGMVARARLHRAGSNLEYIRTNKAVRSEIAKAVHEGRLPERGHEPVSHKDHKVGRRASRRSNRTVRAATHKIRSVYGATDAQGVPFHPYDIADVGRTTYKVGEDKDGNKITVVDYELPTSLNDAGTSAQLNRISDGRYPHNRMIGENRVGAERKNYKAHRKDTKIIGKNQRKIRKTIEGKDLHGRILRSRVDRSNNVLKNYQHKREQRGLLQRSKQINAAYMRPVISHPVKSTIYDTVSEDSFTSHSRPSRKDKRFVDVSGWM